MNTRNPIINGIYSGAIGGFILAIPITLFSMFNIGNYYTAYSLAFVLLIPFFNTFYLGVSVGTSLAFINLATEQEVWSRLGILMFMLFSLLIGFMTDSLISWTVKLTLLSSIIILIKNSTFPSYQEGHLSTPLFKRQKITVATLVTLLLLPIGLQIKDHYQYREVAPFFDGLKLDYGKHSGDMFTFSVIDASWFKVTATEKRGIPKDTYTEYTVNKFGIIEKERHIPSDGEVTEWVRNTDEFIHIWIPANSLALGDMLKDKISYVDRIDKWKRWDVLVIKDSIINNVESYYEIHTGYLVGYSTADYYLIDTNADIPTIND